MGAEVKEQATSVLEGMGLSVSDLMRIVLTRVAKDGAIPFALNPNKLTRETLAKSARGEQVHQAKDAQDVFDELGISCELPNRPPEAEDLLGLAVLCCCTSLPTLEARVRWVHEIVPSC